MRLEKFLYFAVFGFALACLSAVPSAFVEGYVPVSAVVASVLALGFLGFLAVAKNSEPKKVLAGLVVVVLSWLLLEVLFAEYGTLK